MRRFLLSLVALIGLCSAAALGNYAMTQGAGTNFGSTIVGGVHYVQMFICDLTTPGQCAAVSAGGAVKVDGSAVTQPVSGTVTANAGTNLNTSALATQATLASVLTATPTLTTWAGGTLGAMANYGSTPGAVLVPGVNAFVTNTVTANATLSAETTKVIGTVNQGTSPWVVSGTVTATPTGTQAVSAAIGTYAAGALAAGAFATGAGVDGWDITQGAKADSVCGSATGTCSVIALLKYLNTAAGLPIPLNVNTVSTAQTGLTPSATGSTTQTGTVVAANTDQSSIGGSAIFADPCQRAPHVYTRVDIAAAASSVLVAGTASKKTYICGMMLFAAGTTNVGIVEGSGTTCGTSPLGLIGGNTAAKGPNLTAQAGFVAGAGSNAVAGTTVNANDICLINSQAIQVSGYVVTATPTP